MVDDTSDGDAPSSSDSTAPDGDGWSLDALFTALADRRARFVLAHLESIDVDVVTLDDLVDHVAECEAEDDEIAAAEDEGSDAHREEIAIELHHNRLPKLDEATVIDYDPRSRTVRYWGDDRARACLDLFESHEWC